MDSLLGTYYIQGCLAYEIQQPHRVILTLSPSADKETEAQLGLPTPTTGCQSELVSKWGSDDPHMPMRLSFPPSLPPSVSRFLSILEPSLCQGNTRGSQTNGSPPAVSSTVSFHSPPGVPPEPASSSHSHMHTHTCTSTGRPAHRQSSVPSPGWTPGHSTLRKNSRPGD